MKIQLLAIAIIPLLSLPALAAGDPYPLLADSAPAASDEEEAYSGGTVGFKYRFWYPDLTGSIRADDPGLLGEDVGLTTDLGLDRNEPFNEIAGWLEVPLLGGIRANWWWGKFEGSETLTQDIDYSGTTFAVSTEVDSTIELNVVNIVYDRPLLPISSEGVDFQLSAQAGVKYISARGILEGTNTLLAPAREEEVVRGALPIIGGRAEIGFNGIVRVGVEITGLAYTHDDVELRMIDGTAEILVTPFRGLAVGAGYHLVDLFGKDQSGDLFNVEVDLRIDGFYVTAGYAF